MSKAEDYKTLGLGENMNKEGRSKELPTAPPTAPPTATPAATRVMQVSLAIVIFCLSNICI